MENAYRKLMQMLFIMKIIMQMNSKIIIINRVNKLK